MRKITVSLLLVLSALSVRAEGEPDAYSIEAPAYAYTKAAATCRGGERERLACTKRLLDEAERDLAAVYKGRFSFLPKDAVPGLAAAQQAWATSREVNCNWLTRGKRTEIHQLCMLESSINRRYWLLRNIGD